MTKPPHPVPIALGKFKNPKVSPLDWERWREQRLLLERPIAPLGDNGRKPPVRYDEEAE